MSHCYVCGSFETPREGFGMYFCEECYERVTAEIVEMKIAEQKT